MLIIAYIHASVVLVVLQNYRLRNKQSHSHLLHNMTSVIVLFVYQIKKLNISRRKGVTKILSKTLYCYFN